MYDVSSVPIVEAIDDGKIVRVPEDYARREGLPIIRRPVVHKTNVSGQADRVKPKEKGILKFEEFRRPLRADVQRLEAELVDNFHWLVQKKRKERNLTRKQLALSLGASEYDLKMLENGVIVGGNFILVGKIEQFFSINLRKGSGFTSFSKREDSSRKEEAKEKDVLKDDLEVDFSEDVKKDN